MPGLLFALFVSGLLSASGADSPLLPWEREIPLREAAQSAGFESTLNPTNPLPGPSMAINNLKMRTTIWGPPSRITISLTKNNVWDRRVNWYEAPTLKDITEGAFSAVNKDYVGTQPTTLRPKNLGWLRKEGGEMDPYRRPVRYAFPCLKPVGQIILGMDPLDGAPAPRAVQSCANGVVSLQITNGGAKASLEYVLGMANDVYAIRGNFDGFKAPVWLRLYRHRDTSHMMYMNAEGTRYTVPEAEADRAFNGPIAPPTSGMDGRYFWIRQKFPAEKTFTNGFEYVLMGVIAPPGKVAVDSIEGQTGLGTPPANLPILGDWLRTPRAAIADAPGAGATATFTPGSNGTLEALVTIVTTMDGSDLIALAKQKLNAAEAAGGFDAVVRENEHWWGRFYDQREAGRVFHGLTGTACSDDILSLYQQSWTDSHGGGTKTDMRQLESSASYVLPEQDLQGWNSGPCYNEIFTTSRFVHNWADSEDMWKQIVEFWLPGAQEAARDMFQMPGMFISHGYVPPIKPDKYLHTSVTLELCLGTMAQLVRPAWDEWDYGGDTNFLRNECYPLMKEMALFYAAYARKGPDGYYHITPSMQEESWGICPEFSRNKDVISSLCMFRWGLTRAADAAEVLGVDADLSKQWRDVAAQLAPYPTWQRTNGLVFAEMPGLEPVRLPNDHFGDAASYPTVLADDINLDSPESQKEMMIRSVETLPSGNTAQALMLLGLPPRPSSGRHRRTDDDAEMLLNSRSGRIHLFPVAGQSNETSFHNFQARGGFLVSAARNSTGVYYFEIDSRRSIPCRLMNPWLGKSVFIHEIGKIEPIHFTVDEPNADCLTFETIAGHKYLIEPKT